MPPKKKVPATAGQPHKLADKVKPETMTDEVWEHELAWCQYVTKDRNRCRKVTKAAMNARRAETVTAMYVAQFIASGSILARSGSPSSQYHAMPHHARHLISPPIW
jgi:hypothetical protein